MNFCTCKKYWFTFFMLLFLSNYFSLHAKRIKQREVEKKMLELAVEKYNGTKNKYDNKLELQLAFFKPQIEKSMVIITPSYNNSAYYQKNLDATLTQIYSNYRVIYIDDASSDGTSTLVEDYIKEKKQEHKVTLIKNQTRQGAMANWYQAIHSCADHEIVVMVDGDDYLAHPNVLELLNKVYQDPQVWITYGNFRMTNYEPHNHHHSDQLPWVVIRNNTIREYAWVTSHLRTCYAWLFKQVKKEDFMYQGAFFSTLCDHAMMLPMLEMAGTRSTFIPDILLMYNNDNPLNDSKKQVDFDIGTYIRSLPKYQPLSIDYSLTSNL